MAKLSIAESREYRTLSAVTAAGPEGAAVVALANGTAGQIAGATATALTRKGFIEVSPGTPRRAFLMEAGCRRLDELRCRADDQA